MTEECDTLMRRAIDAIEDRRRSWTDELIGLAIHQLSPYVQNDVKDPFDEFLIWVKVDPDGHYSQDFKFNLPAKNLGNTTFLGIFSGKKYCLIAPGYGILRDRNPRLVRPKIDYDAYGSGAIFVHSSYIIRSSKPSIR